MPNHGPYHLQTLFELRERAKKAAEEAFVRAQTQAQQAKERLDSLCAQHEKIVKSREEKTITYSNNIVSGQLIVHNIQTQKCHIEGLKLVEQRHKEKVTEQEEVLRQAQALSDLKFKDMLRAVQEFKSLEKLKEKWILETHNKLLRKEEEFSDEISQSQYSKTQESL